MEIGCIPGRRLALVVSVQNRTKRTVTLLGADGSSSLPGVVDRPAVQVRPAPPPPKGDIFLSGLRRWSRRNPEPVAIPPGRSAWVQSNLLMRNCALLSGPSTVDGSFTLRYRDRGSAGKEVVFVAAARIRLTQGPQHPSLPVNRRGPLALRAPIVSQPPAAVFRRVRAREQPAHARDPLCRSRASSRSFEASAPACAAPSRMVFEHPTRVC
jgi:hypothetical protein